MPLTPAEVHNVAFKKPPIGKRGYDEEEVDAFLDIVEVELSRLIEENNELKARPGGGGIVANGGGASVAELAAVRDDNGRLQARIGELEKALTHGKDGAQQQLVQVQQQLAQTQSDKHLAEAKARADQIERESSAKAAQAVQEAEQRAASITAQLEQRKAALERRVEELRTFEREYRTRLKSYLESQLRDLDASDRAEPVVPQEGQRAQA